MQQLHSFIMMKQNRLENYANRGDAKEWVVRRDQEEVAMLADIYNALERAVKEKPPVEILEVQKEPELPGYDRLTPDEKEARMMRFYAQSSDPTKREAARQYSINRAKARWPELYDQWDPSRPPPPPPVEQSMHQVAERLGTLLDQLTHTNDANRR